MLLPLPARSQRAAVDTARVYAAPDVPAAFDGDLLTYISAHLEFPELDSGTVPESRVVVQFIVRRDGSVSDITFIRPGDRKLEAAFVKLLAGSPRWKPATVRGVPVKSLFRLPVILDFFDR